MPGSSPLSFTEAEVRGLAGGMEASADAGQQPFELHVQGMTCPKCVGRVEKALLKVEGVMSASVTLDDGRAIVTGGNVVECVAMLDDAGYPSKERPFDLKVDGMTCPKCIGRVERALLKVQGVVSAVVTLDDARASVVGGDKEACIAALDDAGYPCTDWGKAAAAADPIVGDGIATVTFADDDNNRNNNENDDNGADADHLEAMGAATEPRGCIKGGEIELDIEGMTCRKCVGRVEAALSKIPGVQSAKASLPGSATIQCVPGASVALDVVCAALDKVGYPARAKGSGKHEGDGGVVTRSIDIAGMQGRSCSAAVEQAIAAVKVNGSWPSQIPGEKSSRLLPGAVGIQN
jgi:copper ion binding protein